MRTVRSMLLALVAVALGLGLVLLGLQFAGYAALDVGREWIKGATGSRYALATSLALAGPLIYTGLSVGVAFRSGVLNIGSEGQYLIGAATVTALTITWPVPGPPWLTLTVALAAGALAGALWAGIAAALERFRGVPVVLSTILLNFVAAQLVALLVRSVLQGADTTSPQSDALARALRMPVLLRGTSLHLGVPIAAGIAVLLWFVLRRTSFGFETLVTGLNPIAARLAGIPVGRRQSAVLLLSGALAGLGGAMELVGTTHFLTDASPGYGYMGIAVALLGRLHPLGIVAAACFFGLLERGAHSVQISSHVPAAIADVVMGVVVLAMLVGTARAGTRRKRISEDPLEGAAKKITTEDTEMSGEAREKEK